MRKEEKDQMLLRFSNELKGFATLNKIFNNKPNIT